MDAMEYWLPAFENVRMRGVPMEYWELRPLLEEHKYLTFLPLYVFGECEWPVRDKYGHLFNLPVVFQGLDPVEVCREVEYYGDYGHLKHLVPGVYGHVDLELTDYPGFYAGMFDEMTGLLYWDCLPISEHDALTVQRINEKVSQMIIASGFEQYEFIQHAYECGMFDPEWLYRALTAETMSADDAEMIKQHEAAGDIEEALMYAEAYGEYLKIEVRGGFEDSILPLEELLDDEEWRLVKVHHRRQHTHFSAYLRSIGREEMSHRYDLERKTVA